MAIERTYHYDPVEQFDDSEDVGLYLAHLRHYLLSACWATATKRGEPLWPTEGEPYHMIRVDGSTGTAHVRRLDFAVENSGRPRDLWQQIQRFPQPPYTFWQRWSCHIEDVLMELDGLPPDVQRVHLWGDLGYSYVEEFDRLTARIGPQEFRRMLWISKKTWQLLTDSHALPPPVQVVSSMPMWTVGQAEIYEWQYHHQDDLLPRWACRRQEYAETRKLLFEIGDDNVGNFVNTGSRFTFFTYAVGDLQRSDATVEHLVQHMKRRVPCHPEVDSALGSRLMHQGRWRAAEPYLLAARRGYEAAIPDGFTGRVYDGDDSDEYLFTCIYLAFLQYARGRRDRARAEFKALEQRLTGEYVIIDEPQWRLEQQPRSFGAWFERAYLEPLPMPGDQPVAFFSE